jgi:hypothetical protein
LLDRLARSAAQSLLRKPARTSFHRSTAKLLQSCVIAACDNSLLSLMSSEKLGVRHVAFLICPTLTTSPAAALAGPYPRLTHAQKTVVMDNHLNPPELSQRLAMVRKG